MGKGDWRRPTQISREEETRRWEEALGPAKLPNCMPEAERLQLEHEKFRLAEECECRPDGTEPCRPCGGA